MSNLEEHEADRFLDEDDGGAATVQLVVDMREMLRVYVSGEVHNETRGQALSIIRDATRWLNTDA